MNRSKGNRGQKRQLSNDNSFKLPSECSVMLRLLPLSKRQVPLFCTAVFAFLWAVVRAHVQSITIDEADTYLAFVSRPQPFHWCAASNNHILNSALMRLLTSVLGPSHISVRAPALLGAALYIGVVYSLCSVITRRPVLQWALFVCLVYNPLIFDYLVAARGYGMAMALALCAIAATAFCLRKAPEQQCRCLPIACGVSSVCLALSLAANFSFGFIDAAILLSLLIWVGRSRNTNPHVGLVPVAAVFILPGLLATLFLTANALLTWPKGQLWFGATSLQETFRSIIDASLYQLNPNIVNPLIYPFLNAAKQILFPLLAVFSIWRLFTILGNRRGFADLRTRWRLGLGLVLSSAMILAVTAHWVCFHWFQLPLPKERTGIYLVPMFMLSAGILAAVPARHRLGVISRVALMAVLCAHALYFILCLRLEYFREWKWNADVRQAYDVVAYYNHKYGVRTVPTTWMYVAGLNFYRSVSGHESLDAFRSFDPLLPGEALYVLWRVSSEAFIVQHRLKVVYHGEISDIVVAIRPGLEKGSESGGAIRH